VQYQYKQEERAGSKRARAPASSAPVVVEVCAGSARLTAAFVEHGVPALAVDWRGNRHQPEAPWLAIDIASTEGIEQLANLLDDDEDLELVWFGLPCGTASRAREIQDRPGLPRPLRTAREPWGRTDIQFGEQEAVRMATANAVYRAALRLIESCTARGVRWIIENPLNSLLWYIPEYVQLLALPNVRDVCYSACMVGGTRAKRQRLRGTEPSMHVVAELWCDGSHQHEPWRQGSTLMTATEAEYPRQFCRMLAGEFAKAWAPRSSAKGSRPSSLAVAASAAARMPRGMGLAAARKAAAGTQPRYGQMPQLVPEYKTVQLLRCSKPEAAELAAKPDGGWLKVKRDVTGGTLQQGSRVLKVFNQKGGRLEDAEVSLVLAGFPWTPSEFIEQAEEVEHPFSRPVKLPDRSLNAVFEVFTQGPSAIEAARRRELRRWEKRAAELDDQEREMFSKAPVDVKACWSGTCDWDEAMRGQWKGKRTLLLEEMAKAAGVPNPGLIAAYLRTGAPAFGHVPASGLFEKEPFEATKSMKEVLQASKWSKPQLRSSVRPSRQPEVDEEVVRRTDDECAEGKAIGPLTEEQVDALLGRVWAPARRVGLVQTGGVRPIDDFTEFGHNSASQTEERIDLGGVDQVVSMAKAVAEAVDDNGVVTVRFTDGTRRQGVVHPQFASLESRRPVGRALDLQKAYKQIPIAASQASLSVVVLWHPEHRAPRYYVLRALPFGARNAVFVFGSVARTLELILTNLFWLILSQYVDDYPQVEPAGSAASASEVTIKVLELLRWTLKAPGGMVPVFGWKFAALGVVFNFEKVMEEVIEVQDKPERIPRVVAIIETIVAAGRAAPGEAETLRGCLAYTRAQCFGRCGAVALHYLSRLAAGPARPVDEEMAMQLRFWPKYLQDAKPRTLKLNDTRPPILVFVDGAEEDVVSTGAVMIDPCDGLNGRQFFVYDVPTAKVEQWKTAGGKQRVIHQAELLPALLAVSTWAARMQGRRIILFVDNDGARGSLIKGSSTSLPSALIVGQFWSEAAAAEMYIWVDRVPSASNPADGPSRHEVQWLRDNGFEEVEAVVRTG
jgi:hypothetical protein